MIIDFHSHILPGIDDGARDVETAVKMLKLSHAQGVDIILATPHFHYSRSDVETAVSKRDKAYDELCAALETAHQPAPEIVRGFEVRNEPGLIDAENLTSLCIENTKTMLVEMPMSEWKPVLFENINTMMECGITVVMAHIERYLNQVPHDIIGKYLDLGVYAQISAAEFMNRETMPVLLELLENDMVHVIGSDAHNLTNRCSFMDIAYRIVNTKLGQRFVDKINENAMMLIGGK